MLLKIIFQDDSEMLKHKNETKNGSTSETEFTAAGFGYISEEVKVDNELVNTFH